MANDKWRLGYGNESDIASAIKNNVLDGKDLIITKDTNRIAFIRPDKSVVFMKSKLESFDSIDEVNAYLKSDKSVYAGELLSVLVNEKYKTYRVQNGESGFELENIENGTKEYVKIVDELPQSGQEEGIIYLSGTTGNIWTGSEWKVVFEDVTSTEDRIKKYVDGLISGLASSVPGVVDSNTPLPSTDYKAGQTWRVAADGIYAGQKCEIGDLIICINDYNIASASDDDFIVVQKNIDGAVTGAESSQDGEIVLFSGVSGKVLKNSGINIEKLKEVIENSHTHENKEILDSFTMSQDELLSDSKNNVDNLKSEIENRLIHTEPYISGRELIANGYGIVIEKVDENTNRATYFVSGQEKSIEFPSGYSVCGGSVDDNCHSSSIVMNSGTVNILQGGSDGDGNVADANIVVNGGTVKSIVGGGYPNTNVTGKANHTGNVKITINNTDDEVSIFGGGYSYASVGEVEICINGGSVDYITTGGSNGFTGNGSIIMNNGSANVIQSVNRGVIGSSNITIKSGTVGVLYAGAETDDQKTTGSFGHSTLHLLGGSIGKLDSGKNNNIHDYDVTSFVSGDYCDGVLSDESQAVTLGLNKISKGDVDHSDIEKAKSDAIAESKAYAESMFTLTEF